jgi:hypothetical protein
MKAICHDCQQVKETHRVMILRSNVSIMLFGKDPVSEVNICADCAEKRVIRDWGTA